MISPITASTEINMIVNGKHTFTIRNNPEEGLLWCTSSCMDRADYIQGLFALTEAAFNTAMSKIEMDSGRLINSQEAIIRG